MLILVLGILSPLQGLAVTGRMVDAKLDFGAVGNGIADDTAALQSALDYLSTNLIEDAGVCLYLPAGTYKITDRLSFAATTPLGDYQGITIRGNARDATNNATVIYSASTNGALLFDINDDSLLYNFMIQLQDLQVQAGTANAGAAVEITKATGTNILLRTTPWFRNVEINRADTNCYFNYGFKMTGVTRPVFTEVNVIGNRPGMTACIALTNHYDYSAFG
jgi:polygalacturonase